jgi:3'-phosphoadenosine 5'-phosphosulfate sulfotransferase (PAPS reductase)/FAD synthetase
VEKIIGAGGLGRWSPTERAEKLVAKAKKALTGKSKRDSARAKKAGVPVGDLSVEFGAIIPWPSADARFCTSDHKRAAVQVLTTSLADKLRDETGQKQVKVLNALGIRAQEGDARESMSAFSRDKQSSAVKVVDRWFPIHLWPEKRVWETIRDSGLPHHVAYDLGMHRLSCAFCVFAKKDDLMIAAKHNPTLFAEYVALEKKMSDTNPTGPAHFTEKLSLQDLFQEILLKRQEGYELNELAEWVKKSFGIELPLSLIKAVTEPSEAEGPVMVILAAALERLRRLGQDIKTLTIEWKTKGACFHLDTPTYSHHVSYQSYPAAWNQSLFAAQFADTMNLTLEEHNAPPAQADLESALTKADRLPGGRADRKRPTDFPADILREGTDHELEHTHSRALAREIAMDHLTEDPDYYVKLGKVEKAGHVLLLGGQPLLKAEQLGMFGMKPKVIRGSWQAIPHTIHPGGQRRRLAGKWEYRYPQPSGGYAPTPHQEELKLPQGVEREFTLPPRPGSPGVPKPASFNEVVAGSVAWAAAARQAGKDIVAHAATVGKPIELAHGSDRAVTIWRNPHGTWRLSYFDKIGASSHEDGEDPVALATEAVRMGYTKFEPGAVDRVVDLEAAAEATARREAWDLDAAARRKAMIREPAKPPKPSTERGMLSSPPKLPTTGEIVLDWKRTEAGKDWTLDAFKVAVEPPEARNPEGQVIGEDAFVKATEPLGMKLQKVVDLVVHHFGVKPDVPTQVRFEPLTLLGGYFDKKKGITLSLDHAAGFHRGVGEALRNAVRVLLHESMHAASNDNLYEPSDWPWRPRAALEEATTEILAQHLTNDFVRPLGAFITDPTPHQLFSMHEGFAGMVAQVDRYDSTSYLSYVTKFAGMAMVVDGLTELKTPMSPVEISNHIAGRAWEVKVKVENAEASDRYNSLADFYLDRVNAKQAITQSVPPRALERDSLEDRLNGVRLDVSKMLGNFMTGSGPFEDTASRKLFNRPPDMWALKKALEAAVQAGGVTDWKYYVRKKAKKPRRLPAAQEATA